jgi:hypothetical protein
MPEVRKKEHRRVESAAYAAAIAVRQSEVRTDPVPASRSKIPVET